MGCELGCIHGISFPLLLLLGLSGYTDLRCLCLCVYPKTLRTLTPETTRILSCVALGDAGQHLGLSCCIGLEWLRPSVPANAADPRRLPCHGNCCKEPALNGQTARKEQGVRLDFSAFMCLRARRLHGIMCNMTGAQALSKGIGLWGTANTSKIRWSTSVPRYGNTPFLLVPLPLPTHIRPHRGTLSS